MEEALRAKLLANTAIAAMAKKIVWGERPDGSMLPSITLSEAIPGRNYTHDGADDLIRPNIQFDVWAETTWDCILLKRLIISEMETPSVNAGYEIGFAFLEAQHPGMTEDIDGGQKVNRIIQEWEIPFSPTS